MWLYNLVIKPIEIIIDFAYVLSENMFPLLGAFGNIFFVSLVVNLVALPIYNKADGLQKAERDKYNLLKPGIDRIKKAFKGNERFMMLNEYYRQNSYHPLYALKSALSIIIEIPVFIAAYHYLSAVLPYDRDFFWLFKDAGMPDALLSVQLFGHNIAINVLPILMTLINFVSGYIYTKGAAKRDKVQVYVLGLFFLVLLYNSPSGLVFYWILNNLFSLCKNIAVKTKEPKKWLFLYCGAIVVLAGILMFIHIRIGMAAINYGKHNAFFVSIIGILLVIYAVFYKTYVYKKIFNSFYNFFSPCKRMFSDALSLETSSNMLPIVVLSGICLTLLYGFVVPSSAIATSPIEFSFIGQTDSPFSYIVNAVFIFAGCFIVWPIIIYRMFDKRVKNALPAIMFVILVTSLFNVFVFKGDYGLINAQFYYYDSDKLKNISFVNMLFPFVISVVSLFVFSVIIKRNKLFSVFILLISVILTNCVIIIKNSLSISKTYNLYKENKEQITLQNITPQIQLSNNQKNTVIIFLDSAMGELLPYIIDDIPSLKQSFSGFTYFPNTVSFAPQTVTVVPSMLGGYEYTPEELNNRSDELMQDKHNEASLILPTLFNELGYRIFITNLPYPNYEWVGDYSKFTHLLNIKTCDLTKDKSLQNIYVKEVYGDIGSSFDKATMKEIVNFSMLQTTYPLFRYVFNEYLRSYDLVMKTVFNIPSKNADVAISNIAPLYLLPRLTTFDNSSGSYVFFGNDITHNDSFFSDDNITITNKNGFHTTSYPLTTDNELGYYSVNRTGLYLIGQWCDYLKQNGAYDNTRIIIVADHGKSCKSVNSDILKNPFIPLLMFKDFNSRGEIKTDYSFMTNADTPFLAMDNLVNDLINPFTSKKMEANKDKPLNLVYPYPGENTAVALKQKNTKVLNLSNIAYTFIPGSVEDDSNWVQKQ